MAYIYLVGDSEKEKFYKIGMTRGDINSRIKKLQTGNGGDIYLVSSFETKYPSVLEKMLHNKYQDYQIMNEWFLLDKDVVDSFKNVCEILNENIMSLEDNYFFKKKYKKE
jgi:hypothetical protein